MGSDDVETESWIPAGLSAREFALVARLPIFTGLDQARTRRLLDHALVRSFGRSAVLFLQDEPATRFYVILDGWVRLYRQTSEGQESTIAVYARGDSFAEAAILQSGAFPVTAVVIDDARLLVIEAEPFLRHLRADPKLCLNMMASMSNHLRRLVQQVEQLTVRSSTERLGDFLLRLVPAGDAGGAVVRLPLDKAMIAAGQGDDRSPSRHATRDAVARARAAPSPRDRDQGQPGHDPQPRDASSLRGRPARGWIARTHPNRPLDRDLTSINFFCAALCQYCIPGERRGKRAWAISIR
jgi:CRP-like cAMP-binding protein